MNRTQLQISAALLIGISIGISGTWLSMQNSIPSSEGTVGETSNLWQKDILKPSYLAKNSDLVVRGQVTQIEDAQWDTEDGNRPKKLKERQIFHEAKLNVSQVWKGRPREELTIHIKGGKVGNISLYAEDSANLVRGDRALFFLQKDNNHWEIVGQKHGVFHITGDKAVRRDVPPRHRTFSISTLTSAAR